MQRCSYASLQSRLVRPDSDHDEHEKRKRESVREKCSHQARFRVPEKIGPVGVRLHLAKDEEFVQTEINHPRCDLRVSRYHISFARLVLALVYGDETHLVAIRLGKTMDHIFPDASTIHMFHYQHLICTSFPHPRDFEACVVAEPFRATERAHTCRLACI